MKYCSICGTAISSQAQVCPNCGNPISINFEEEKKTKVNEKNSKMQKKITKSLEDNFNQNLSNLKQEIDENLINSLQKPVNNSENNSSYPPYPNYQNYHKFNNNFMLFLISNILFTFFLTQNLSFWLNIILLSVLVISVFSFKQKKFFLSKVIVLSLMLLSMIKSLFFIQFAFEMILTAYDYIFLTIIVSINLTGLLILLKGFYK